MFRPALLAATFLALSLVACGGGGSRGDGPDPLAGHGFGAGPSSSPSGAGSGTGAGEEPFTWRALGEGGAPQVTSPDFQIIRTQAEYDALCSLVTIPDWQAGLPPFPGPPVIDFDREMVVAVFLGTRPTGRYRASITNIVRQGDGIHVDYLEWVPTGPGCPPDTSPATQPCALATCTREEGSATFTGSVEYCDFSNL